MNVHDKIDSAAGEADARPRRRPALSARAWLGISLALLSGAGCDGNGKDPAPVSDSKEVAPPAELPLLVDIGASDVQSGFVGGTQREQRALPAYRITKHPITWAQFDRCVEAGACEEADDRGCDATAYAPYRGYALPDYTERHDDAPAACVGEVQAEAYCSWVGGELPTLDEWLNAARGQALRRFAWGDAVTACDQHPVAPQLMAHFDPERFGQPAAPGAVAAVCAEDAPADAELRIGAHEAGASPSGLQDVLLLPGELLEPDPDGMFNACGGVADHCVVFGLDPASIDAVEPFYRVASKAGEADSARVSTVAHAYGFRCVLASARKVAP